MPATERFPREAERHLIASAFVDPDWLHTARDLVRPEHFSEPALGQVWSAILSSTSPGEVTDEITLTNALRATGDLDAVGGPLAINELGSILIGPSPAVSRWQQAVLDGHRLRTLRDSLERVLKQADSNAFTADELLANAALAVQASETAAASVASRPPQRFDHKDLVAFDRASDPDCIFGMRYLGRGQSCMFIAGTGVGKSSFINGAACHWALGRDYFGFKPKCGPLRTLIVQSENCLGDTAEAYQDALAGMGIPLESQLAAEIGDRVAFFRESIRTGEAFGKVLRELILSHRADITVIDPMLGFSAVDVSKQDQLSHWLRGILQPIMLETKTCLFTVHHTNKPRPAGESALVNFDNLAYLGSGGAELANWHRSTLALIKDPTPEGEEEKPHYSLVAAKRGSRAGLKDDLGNFTRIIKLRHARQPGIIRWERRTDLDALPDPSPIERKGTAKAFGRGNLGHP